MNVCLGTEDEAGPSSRRKIPKLPIKDRKPGRKQTRCNGDKDMNMENLNELQIFKIPVGVDIQKTK